MLVWPVLRAGCKDSILDNDAARQKRTRNADGQKCEASVNMSEFSKTFFFHKVPKKPGDFTSLSRHFEHIQLTGYLVGLILTRRPCSGTSSWNTVSAPCTPGWQSSAAWGWGGAGRQSGRAQLPTASKRGFWIERTLGLKQTRSFDRCFSRTRNEEEPNCR